MTRHERSIVGGVAGTVIGALCGFPLLAAIVLTLMSTTIVMEAFPVILWGGFAAFGACVGALMGFLTGRSDPPSD